MSYVPPLIALGLVALLLFVARFRMPSKIPTTRDGALLALTQVLEWSKWMSGIQTAAIGGLMLLVFKKDFEEPQSVSCLLSVFAYSGFACLGAALYCSAWVLDSNNLRWLLDTHENASAVSVREARNETRESDWIGDALLEFEDFTLALGEQVEQHGRN